MALKLPVQDLSKTKPFKNYSMKKLFTIFLSSVLAATAFAQEDLTIVKTKPVFAIDFSLMNGAFNQSISQTQFAPAYLNRINDNISGLQCNNRKMSGFSIQLGYFFGKHHNWGIGTGLVYSTKKFDLSVDQYHVEYQSTDDSNNIFRQGLTANSLSEKITVTNLSIPFLVKYQRKLGDKLAFNFDAGFLLTMSNTNKFAAASSFDYEAYYQYTTVNNQTVTVYDPNPTPSVNDWLITKENYSSAEMSNFQTNGMNVGLDVTYNNSGTINTKARALGWIIQPSVTYKINNNISLLGGCFIMKQSFKNSDVTNSYQTTDKIGDYNSLLNAITQTTNVSYGINIGVRYLFSNNNNTTTTDEIVE